MKRSLLFASIALCPILATAQSYHGFSINASQELIDNTLGGILSTNAYRIEGKAITLQVLYQPQYQIQTVNDALTTWTPGSTTKGDSGSCMDYTSPSTGLSSGQKEVNESLVAGDIDGIVLKSYMGADGLSYVDMPKQYYKNGVLTDIPATGGDIRVRFCTESKSTSRLGDDPACYVTDITGVYVTVSAPSTVKITSDYVQANTSTTFSASAGAPDDDGCGKVQRLAYFEMPSTNSTTPQDITFKGKAKGSWNLFTWKRNNKDAYGFPLRYIDIVFYGVKPGEKVGWTNYQSLHDGYTPVPYSGAGIGEVASDDANAPVEYFNLQGIKVAQPEKGIFIERQGSKTRKVMF